MRILSFGENVRYASVPIVSWLAVGVVINPLVRSAVLPMQDTGRRNLVAKGYAVICNPYVALSV